MTKVLSHIDILPVIVHLPPVITLTDDQLYELCQINRALRIERTAEGDLVIMPPTGGETGHRNSILVTLLTTWAWQDDTGVTFDSSTGFTLPNGALRSPDASWVRRSRVMRLTAEQRERFLPLCPDCVVELRSPPDTLSGLQSKMQEYIDNGAQLGWLIDPHSRRVYVYRPNRGVESLENPATIAGDPVLPGFVLALQKIWALNF